MTKAVRVVPRGASTDVNGVVVRSFTRPVVTSVRWLRWGIGLVALQLGVADDSSAHTGQTSAACTFAGHQLYGRIQVVKQHADLRVQVVEHFPDLRVKLVERFADSCGEWLMVERFPDTTVTFVTRQADLTLKYVGHFPGLP